VPEAAVSQQAARRPIAAATLRRALWVGAVAACVGAAGPASASTGSADGASRAPDYRKALETSQAAIGRPLADIRMRDSNGKDVRFSDYRGRPLLISLVYTGCFQACPVSTQFLAETVRVARKALGDDKFRVVSVGFNQPFDSPPAMAAFQRQNRIVEPGWDFLSPDPTQVDALTANLGFTYEATPKGFDHVTQVTIVDGNGVIYRQVYGENFDLPMLVQPLKELLSGEAAQHVSLENLWERVILYCTVYDPMMGGYRVNYSLFFEIFAGLTTLGAIGWVVMRELRRSSRA